MPPSTDFHLGHIVIVLRRSPASVTSSSLSTRRRADETLPRPQLDLEFEGRHRAERVQIAEVPCVRYLIGWIAKMFNYINRVTSCFRFRSTRVCGHTLPARCYASPRWILRVRRQNFEILRSPTVASEPGLCVDVICMSRAQRVVGDNSQNAYQHVIL